MSGQENFTEGNLNAYLPFFGQQYLPDQHANQQDLDNYQSLNSQQSTLGIQADINSHGNSLNMVLGSEASIEQPSPSVRHALMIKEIRRLTLTKVNYGCYDSSLPSSPPPALSYNYLPFEGPTTVTLEQLMVSRTETLQRFEATNLTPTVYNGPVAANQSVYHQDMIPSYDLTGIGLPNIGETNAHAFHIPVGNTAEHSKDKLENPQQDGVNFPNILGQTTIDLNL